MAATSCILRCNFGTYFGSDASRAGWDVEANGLTGAPPMRVVIGEERHITIDRALHFLGIGITSFQSISVDGQGRMQPDALRAVLAESHMPTILCAHSEAHQAAMGEPMRAI
jgi:glutamate/tyrosine decarboxylase-like PLP-dependent enzyme